MIYAKNPNPPAHVCVNPNCKGRPDPKGMALGGTAWLCSMECRHEVARAIYDYLTDGKAPPGFSFSQPNPNWFFIQGNMGI